jgi:hypothetical protein
VKFRGAAILECLAMGRRLFYLPDLVEGENGRYVPTLNPSTLSAEIRQSLSRPEEAVRMGANGRKLVERQMNLELYVQRLVDFLGEVINCEEGRRAHAATTRCSKL